MMQQGDSLTMLCAAGYNVCNLPCLTSLIYLPAAGNVCPPASIGNEAVTHSQAAALQRGKQKSAFCFASCLVLSDWLSRLCSSV